MSTTLSVFIAERNYPIKIKEGEEQLIHTASKMINEKIESFKTQYTATDMQDYLAMSALMTIVDLLQKPDSNPGVLNELEKIKEMLNNVSQ